MSGEAIGFHISAKKHQDILVVVGWVSMWGERTGLVVGQGV